MLRARVLASLLLAGWLALGGPIAAHAGVTNRGMGRFDGIDSSSTATTTATKTQSNREAARRAYEAWLAQKKQEHYLTVQHLPECNVTWNNTPADWCEWQPPEATGGRAPRELVEAYVRTVTASIQLPEAFPQVGPDPAWNEWNMAVVGIPYWLWVEGPQQVTDSISEGGLSVSLTAHHSRTTFDMGDGRTVTCTATQPFVRDAVPAATPSPVCGHTYQVAPKSPSPSSAATKEPGTYTITATTHWTVNWAAGGYTGTLPTTMTGTRDLPVGELQAVVVRS